MHKINALVAIVGLALAALAGATLLLLAVTAIGLVVMSVVAEDARRSGGRKS